MVLIEQVAVDTKNTHRWSALRGSSINHRETPIQGIIEADRLQTRLAHALHLVEQSINKHPRKQGSDVPTTCYQSPNDRVLCAFGVGVEILWIKLSSKGNNLLCCDSQRAKIERLTDVEILKLAHRCFLAGRNSPRPVSSSRPCAVSFPRALRLRCATQRSSPVRMGRQCTRPGHRRIGFRADA